MGAKEEINNAASELSGHVKELAGEATGNEKLEDKGHTQVEEARTAQDGELAREDRERKKRVHLSVTGTDSK